MNWIPVSKVPIKPTNVKTQTVELLLWDNVAKDIKRGYYRGYVDAEGWYYCDATDTDNITHYAYLPEPPFFDIDMGHGKCMEKHCDKFATADYNGHGHWVCDSHNERLNNEFEDEYR